MWVVTLIMYVIGGLPLVPYHGDESTLIYMSHDYADQFIEGDLTNIRYSLTPANPMDQELRLINGTIPQLTIGMAWQAAGFSEADINEPWNWGWDYPTNIENGHAPREDLLHASRWASTLFTAGAVVIIFFLGKTLAGRPVAYMASLYFGLSPAVILNGRRAIMEGSMVFFAMLTLLAGAHLLRTRGIRAWGWTLVLGIVSGLAVASKHTGVVVVFSTFAGAALYTVLHNRPQFLQRFGQLVVAGVLSLVVFYGLNPAWWGGPVERAGQVLNMRSGLLDIQADVFGGYTDEAAGTRFVGFWRQVFVARPMFYEVDGWAEFITDEIAAYEASVYDGLNPPSSEVAVFGLFVLGLLVLFGNLKAPTVDAPLRWLFGTWVVLTLAFTLLLTPLEWQRYYLPAYPVVALLAPLGIMWVVQLYVRDALQHSPEYPSTRRFFR